MNEKQPCDIDYNLKQVAEKMVQVCGWSDEKEYYERIVKIAEVQLQVRIDISHGICATHLESEFNNHES